MHYPTTQEKMQEVRGRGQKMFLQKVNTNPIT